MEKLLVTENLKKCYTRKSKGVTKKIHALNDVSLTLYKGNSLALIGESGSGKSTFGKAVAMLDPPDSGTINFLGKDIQGLTEKAIRPLRKEMQMIFQSSGGVFDPTYTIGDSIKEVIKNYDNVSNAECNERVAEILQKSGLEPRFAKRHATELSGGQCQRANIARALVLKPKLVICDEPVASLDYSIRKQILNLLNRMQQEFQVTYILITHDLSNVPYVCQSIAIMFQGQIMEYLDGTSDLKKRAIHPYTKALFDSIPISAPSERKPRTVAIGAKPIQEQAVENGCSFCNRCPYAKKECFESIPALRQIGKGHSVACHIL